MEFPCQLLISPHHLVPIAQYHVGLFHKNYLIYIELDLLIGSMNEEKLHFYLEVCPCSLTYITF